MLANRPLMSIGNIIQKFTIWDLGITVPVLKEWLSRYDWLLKNWGISICKHFLI